MGPIRGRTTTPVQETTVKSKRQEEGSECSQVWQEKSADREGADAIRGMETEDPAGGSSGGGG